MPGAGGGPPGAAAAWGGAHGPGEVQVRGRRPRDFGDPQEEKPGGWLQAFPWEGKGHLQAAVPGWAGKV